jgi:hypothetical protein
MLIANREPVLQSLSDLRQAIACVDLGLIGEDGIASGNLEINSSGLPEHGFDIGSAEGFTVIELCCRREFLRNARLGKNARRA